MSGRSRKRPLLCVVLVGVSPEVQFDPASEKFLLCGVGCGEALRLEVSAPFACARHACARTMI